MKPKTKIPELSLPTFPGLKKNYISFAILGMLSILLIILIIFPSLKQIKKISGELLTQKNNLASFSEEIKNLKDSKNLYEAYRENLERIDEVFVDSEIPIEFISFLEKNATTSQLLIEVSSVATIKKETDLWPSLSFQISTTGSASNFLKFLEKLENSPYLIEISNLNLKKLARKEEIVPSNINATLLIRVFAK